VHKWLLLFLLLTACQVNDCGVEPTVEFEVPTKEKQSESNTEEEKQGIIDQVKDITTPGGQVKCTF